jgi:predicted O-linked N-acetylglucosamine transferase (SPINDLY family)
MPALTLVKMQKQTANREAEWIRLYTAGRFADLEKATRAVLRLQPNYGFGWKLLGAALHAQGKDALPAFTKAGALLPQDAEAHNNLGTALTHKGESEAALLAYQKAIALVPGYAEARANVARLLGELGRTVEALPHARAWVELQPASSEAHARLGNLLRESGDSEGAIAEYHRVLELGDQRLGNLNLGAAYFDIGDFSRAMAYGEKAVELAPDMAESHFNYGTALSSFGRVAEAIPCFARAVAIKPGDAYLHHNLLFNNNYLPYPDAQQLDDARRYGALAAARATPYTAWQTGREPGKALRVGLVSNDFRNHPVGHFLHGALGALAGRAELEFHGYTNHRDSDAITEEIRTRCRGWREVRALSDAELAAAIHGDAIDILLDLGGHTKGSRLDMFAWKPAPVQASWLGYFATTGLAAMDYLIADRHTLPPGEDAAYVERIWRLPDTRLCFSDPGSDIPVGPLPLLANGYPTFGCFNNLSKIHDGVVALWARVLHAIPDARLLLKNKQFADVQAAHYLAARFAAHGVAAERLHFEGPSSRADYLAAHNRIDIALDPFPYTGGTTTAEALWMGVPVLTLAGERFLARQSEGLLNNAGLEDWVARNADDYVAKATGFVRNPSLATLRQGLRTRALASPVFDAPRFAAHFAQALRGMWQQWCTSQA